MKFYIFLTIYFFTYLNIFAQKDTVQLEVVTVSATLLRNEIKNTARNISIIDRKTLESAPVKTLDGILQYALNVDVRSRSAFGVQADISIRGGHYDQTLILLDGVKVNDPQTGHHALNLPVPFSMIEKIEVLQGGASRVFGPSAFSGVINIITKKPAKSEGEIHLGAGQFHTWQSALYGTWVKDKWNVGAGLDLVKSEGFQAATDYKKHSLNVNAERSWTKGTIQLLYGQMSNDFGASNFYHPKFFNQYEEVSSHLANLAWKQRYSDKWQSTFLANYRLHYDMFDFDNYRNTDKINLLNVHRSDVWDIEWKFNYKNHTAFGLEWRKEGILSNRIGDPLDQPRKEAKDWSDLTYTHQKSRDNLSLFFERKFVWQNFNLNVGTLGSYNSKFGFSLFPGLDLGYALDNTSRIYYTVNRSLRFPTFTELYLKNNTVTGDPNLLPEKAWTQELGFKKQSHGSLSQVSLFYTHTEDAIDKVKRPGITVPLMENMDYLNRWGIELAQKWNFSKNPIRLKQFSLNYAWIHADKKEEGYQSFYTLNYLKHKATLGTLFEPLPSWNLSLWYTFKDRAGQYSWDDASAPIDYASFGLLDFRTSYKIQKFEIRLDLNNLLNKEYFEYGFVKQPPRTITGTIVYGF